MMMMMMMMTVTLHCTLHILMTPVKLHVQLQYLKKVLCKVMHYEIWLTHAQIKVNSS